MLMEVVRLEKGTSGVFGACLLFKEAFCVTLEPEDKGNQTGISCIPLGVYTCKRKISPHFGETFEVLDVPDRDNILIHPGNSEHDTMGCILLARSFGILGNNRAILNSGETFKEFLRRMKGINSFQLQISEYRRMV